MTRFTTKIRNLLFLVSLVLLMSAPVPGVTMAEAAPPAYRIGCNFPSEGVGDDAAGATADCEDNNCDDLCWLNALGEQGTQCENQYTNHGGPFCGNTHPIDGGYADDGWCECGW